jgi:signal transduction histidine kinase
MLYCYHYNIALPKTGDPEMRCYCVANNKFIILLLCIFFYNTAVRAQEGINLTVTDEISQLEHTLNKAVTDSESSLGYMKIINYYNGADNDSAMLYAREGLRHFRERKYKPGQARMVLALGSYDDTHGNSSSADEKVTYAIALFKEANDNTGMADAYNIMGVIEAKKGNFDKAMYYFIEAQKIYISCDNKKGLFATWMNLGLLYDNLNDSAKLFLYYGKADSISSHIPLSDNVIGLYNNLGASYFEHQDTAKGFGYMTKALRLSEKPGYLFTHIVCLMSMGEIMYSMGRKAGGKNYLKQALYLARQHNLPTQEAGIYINSVTLFKDLDEDTSIAYLDKAIQIARATGNKPRELEAYRVFINLYDSDKNYKESNRYLKLENALSDSIFNINKIKDIANIAAVYDLQVSNARINDLEDLIRKNKAQKNIIICIIVLLIILCGVLYYFFTIVYRYYTVTKKLNHRLKDREKDLAQLNNMKDKLFSVIGHDLRGPMANIPVIIGIIEEETTIEEPFKGLLLSLKEQAEATVETLEKLLLLGKSVMKGKTITFVNFAPGIYIRKNIELLHLLATKKNITIEDNALPDDIYADSGHFDFIIRNLLSNAIKFSFSGGKIILNSSPDAIPGFILFSVADNGAGIKASELPRMFKSSVNSTYGTANEKGTGIGLMLCEEFVTLNGGKIWVESKEGIGSTFYFSLKKAT